MKKIAILENEIFDLLEQKDAEIGLSNTLVRNDRIFGLIASIERRLQIKMKITMFL